MFFKLKPRDLPSAETALTGRDTPIKTAASHFVSGRPLEGPYPPGAEVIFVGMGCFWGAERLFWGREGVWVTAVGYQGGLTPNPTYEEVCSGQTGHTEAVMVVYDPEATSVAALLKLFFEEHDPTQGMRQGNDVGTQYRSAIYTTSEAQLGAARTALKTYDARYRAAKGFGAITTEVKPAGPFYFAEAYHQQYLAKNPGGYCGLSATGVSCPLPTGITG
jgi:peptide-methionine (S)-S-oxide reductase